jgi:hypothetical protein
MSTFQKDCAKKLFCIERRHSVEISSQISYKERVQRFRLAFFKAPFQKTQSAIKTARGKQMQKFRGQQQRAEACFD